MDSLFPLWFYLQGLTLAALPQWGTSTSLSWTQTLAPSVQAHHIVLYRRAWALEANEQSHDAFRLTTLGLSTTLQPHPQLRLRLTPLVQRHKLAHLPGHLTGAVRASALYLREPLLLYAVWEHPLPSGLYNNTGRRWQPATWELRQLYFIDDHWSLGAGWRPIHHDLSPLLLTLNFHQKHFHAHLLQQGPYTSLGIGWRRAAFHVECQLSTAPLLPQTALHYAP